MKKISKIIIIFAMMIFITACGNKVYKTYEEMSYSDYLTKVENKESFILFIGSSTCSHCDDFKKTVNKIMNNYDVVINYIDLSKLSEKEYNTFSTLTNFGGSTPTTIFIEDGKEKNVYVRIVGALPYNTVVEKLKKLDYIK